MPHGREPPPCHRLCLPCRRNPADRRGRLPRRLVSYGIEGSCFSAGASLSLPVREAVAVLSERLLTELIPGAPAAAAG